MKSELLEVKKAARGRPPLEHAQSAAERAKAYRLRKKAGQPVKRDEIIVTNKPPSAAYGLLESRIVLLNAENMQLSDKLQTALDKIAELTHKLRR